MRASRVTGAINIDGKLDEPAWAAATPSSDFTQSYPKVGAKPTDPTEVRVLYDDDALYVGVRMFDAHPDSIAAQLARRDASGIYSDWLHVIVDSYHDRRTAFRFSVNPRGVQKDVLEFDDRNEEPTDGRIYIAWAQFHGNGSNSPIFVAVSSDGGQTFSTPAQITASTVRSNQDARIVTSGDGSHAYLVFDNGVQGGKGAVMYVSESSDRGVTWSAPVRFASFNNPVCLFPPFCFNVSGNPFRGPGSYPVPAFDPVGKRLYVAYADIVGGLAQLFLASAPAGSITDATKWKIIPMAPGNSGDRLNVEMSIDRASGRIDFISEDRSYSNNTLVDITYGKSFDQGTSFATQRVTRAGYDPALYGVPSGSGFRPFIGDYNGIVSLPTKAAFAWTGVGKSFGPPPINLDIFFGAVTP